MIRKLEKSDVNTVAEIWLNTNLSAHSFICGEYWRSNFELVKEMLTQSEVYVCENDGKIQGFVGLNGDYIEGIFVCKEMQSHGAGTLLLNYVKNIRDELSLNVYQKNTRAINFYLREGFEILRESTDDDTGEKDYVMFWRNSGGKHKN